MNMKRIALRALAASLLIVASLMPVPASANGGKFYLGILEPEEIQAIKDVVPHFQYDYNTYLSNYPVKMVEAVRQVGSLPPESIGIEHEGKTVPWSGEYPYCGLEGESWPDDGTFTPVEGVHVLCEYVAPPKSGGLDVIGNRRWFKVPSASAYIKGNVVKDFIVKDTRTGAYTYPEDMDKTAHVYNLISRVPGVYVYRGVDRKIDSILLVKDADYPLFYVEWSGNRVKTQFVQKSISNDVQNSSVMGPRRIRISATWSKLRETEKHLMGVDGNSAYHGIGSKVLIERRPTSLASLKAGWEVYSVERKTDGLNGVTLLQIQSDLIGRTVQPWMLEEESISDKALAGRVPENRNPVVTAYWSNGYKINNGSPDFTYLGSADVIKDKAEADEMVKWLESDGVRIRKGFPVVPGESIAIPYENNLPVFTVQRDYGNFSTFTSYMIRVNTALRDKGVLFTHTQNHSDVTCEEGACIGSVDVELSDGVNPEQIQVLSYDGENKGLTVTWDANARTLNWQNTSFAIGASKWAMVNLRMPNGKTKTVDIEVNGVPDVTPVHNEGNPVVLEVGESVDVNLFKWCDTCTPRDLSNSDFAVENVIHYLGQRGIEVHWGSKDRPYIYLTGKLDDQGRDNEVLNFAITVGNGKTSLQQLNLKRFAPFTPGDESVNGTCNWNSECAGSRKLNLRKPSYSSLVQVSTSDNVPVTWNAATSSIEWTNTGQVVGTPRTITVNVSIDGHGSTPIQLTVQPLPLLKPEPVSSPLAIESGAVVDVPLLSWCDTCTPVDLTNRVDSGVVQALAARGLRIEWGSGSDKRVRIVGTALGALTQSDIAIRFTHEGVDYAYDVQVGAKTPDPVVPDPISPPSDGGGQDGQGSSQEGVDTPPSDKGVDDSAQQPGLTNPIDGGGSQNSQEGGQGSESTPPNSGDGDTTTQPVPPVDQGESGNLDNAQGSSPTVPGPSDNVSEGDSSDNNGKGDMAPDGPSPLNPPVGDEKKDNGDAAPVPPVVNPAPVPQPKPAPVDPLPPVVLPSNPPSSTPVPVPPVYKRTLPDWDTLYGKTRHETTTNVMRAIFGQKVDTVMLTRDDNAVDARAGLSYAVNNGIPVVQSNPTIFMDTTKAFLEDMAVPGAKVIILGGHAAISKGIEQELIARGYRVERLGGATRVETFNEIVRKSGFDPMRVHGQDLPDADVLDAVLAKRSLSFTDGDRPARQHAIMHEYRPGDQVTALYYMAIKTLWSKS